MNKSLGLILVALGALFFLKLFAAGWFLFLIVAAGLAFGASTGAIGKWGYAAAAVVGLMSVPALLFSTFFATLKLAGVAMAMTIKLLPLLLVAYGLYVLLRAFSR